MAFIVDKDGKPFKVYAAKDTNLVSELYFGTAEKTIQLSADDPDSQTLPFNPDPVYNKSGDYSIYEEMALMDDQVNAALQLKKDIVLGSGWVIVSEGDDEEVASDLEATLKEDTDIPLEQQLEEILSAYDYGFSISEKIFQINEGSLSLKHLKTRHPNTWKVIQDDKGNPIRYEQTGHNGNVSNINAKSLIHYINKPRFQNPYGTSDLRSAYMAWFTKRQIVRYYAIFMEKAASPMPVAKYPLEVSDEAVTKLFNSIKSFQAKTAMVVPKEVELEFLEAKQNGEVYEKAINLFNMFISRSLLIPDLVGLGGSETSGGSFSLGQEQMALFFKHIRRRQEVLESIINKHIIRPLVVFNHGFMDHFPKFKFKPIKDDQAGELAKLWLEAVNGKTYTPSDEEINHFRDLVRFPTGDVERPEPEAPPFQRGFPNDPSDPEGGDGPVSDDEIDDAAAGTLDPNDESKMRDAAKQNRDKEYKSSYAKVFGPPPGDFHKKVNFRMIEGQMNGSLQSTLDKAAPIVEAIYRDLFEQIERKKIVKNQNFERVAELKLKKLRDLKSLLKSELRGTWSQGQASGQSELIKGNFRTPLPDEKFLEVLDAETFDFVGDWEFKQLGLAKDKLRVAIRDGLPLSAVIDELEAEALPQGMTSLERFSRTKTTDVFNRGRHNFFEESGVVQGYQYSAILDSRTTTICAGLDGKFFKSGTEPIPPMHFNCRSLLVPVTKFEEFKPSPDQSKFIENNVGKGFSVK